MIYNIYNLIVLIVILSAGLIFTINFSKNYKLKINFIVLLYFWHLFFSLIYFFYTFYKKSDAYTYYYLTLTRTFSHIEPGSHFISNICYLLGNIGNLSFMNVFAIFNFIGFLGLLFLTLSLNKIKKIELNNYYILIIFLPSISFWSSAIGKDAISFLAICLFIWSSIDLKNKVHISIISVLIMFLVRPHISIVMLFSLAIAVIFQKNIQKSIKIFIFIFLSLSFAILLPIVSNFVNIKIDYFSISNTFSTIKGYISLKMVGNISESAGIDLSSMNFIEIIFTFYFRPLPFETNNFMQLFTSVENVILIIFFLTAITFKILSPLSSNKIKYSNIQLWIYIIIVTFLLSSTQANLGITSRQKWMVLPILIFIFYNFFNSKEYLFKKNKLTN